MLQKSFLQIVLSFLAVRIAVALPTTIGVSSVDAVFHAARTTKNDKQCLITRQDFVK
jgi:hypothetical protein